MKESLGDGAFSLLSPALLPATGDRNVSSLPEGAQTAVTLAAVPETVAVEVQPPQPCMRIEDAEFCRPRSIPVSDHGKVTRDAEGAQTAVTLAAVPETVAVEVQPPQPLAGTEEPNGVSVGIHRPMTDDREIAWLAKRVGAEVCRTAVPKIIAIAVQLPKACTRIKDAKLASVCSRPVANKGKTPLLAKRAETTINLAIIPHAVVVEVKIPCARAGAENSNFCDP